MAKYIVILFFFNVIWKFQKDMSWVLEYSSTAVCSCQCMLLIESYSNVLPVLFINPLLLEPLAISATLSNSCFSNIFSVILNVMIVQYLHLF